VPDLLAIDQAIPILDPVSDKPTAVIRMLQVAAIDQRLLNFGHKKVPKDYALDAC
jgi:hypothetical protein